MLAHKQKVLKFCSPRNLKRTLMKLTKYLVFTLIMAGSVGASAQDVVSKSAIVNQLLVRSGNSLTRGERDEIERHLDAILQIAQADRNRRSLRDSVSLNGRQVT